MQKRVQDLVEEIKEQQTRCLELQAALEQSSNQLKDAQGQILRLTRESNQQQT